MPKLLTPANRPQRATLPFLVALAALFLLGPTAGAANAQEEVTSVTEISEQTILQESTSGDGSSDTSAASGDAAMPKGIKVGDGEAAAGDAYAGNGCARAGDITAGDCDEKGPGGGDSADGSGSDSGSGGSDDPGRPEDDEDTTVPETTSEETTLLEDTTGGETTNTASPVLDERGLCPAGPPKDVVEATIEGTLDGDTLELAEEVDGYDTVRLIGVDTPELEGGQPEPLSEEASDFTAQELEGQEVLLQIGEEKTDEYGRLLAYVWTAPDGGVVGGLKRMVGMGEAELFNLTLLEEGYAEVLTIEPNDLYAECFETTERDAREAGVSIGAEDESTGGPADDQYDEETTPETTTQASPPQNTESGTEPVKNTPTETAPTQNAPEAAPTTEDDTAAEEPARQPSPAEGQYEQSPPPEARSSEPEIQDEEIREPEVQEPEVQESVAPSGGDEAAALQTGASPGASVEASASPEPADALPVRTASTAPVSVLPETGGPSLLSPGIGIAAAGLLAGAVMGFLAVRSILGRDFPGRR